MDEYRAFFANSALALAALLTELALLLRELKAGENGSPFAPIDCDLVFLFRSSGPGPGVPIPAVVDRADLPPIEDMLPARCLRERRRCVKGETVDVPDPSMTACCAGSDDRGRKVPIIGTGASEGIFASMGNGAGGIGDTGADADAPGVTIDVGYWIGNGGAGKSSGGIGGPGRGYDMLGVPSDVVDKAGVSGMDVSVMTIAGAP